MPGTVGYERNAKIRSRLSKEMQTRLDSARDRLQYGMDYRMMKREQAWRDSLKQYDNEIGWDRREDFTADIVNVNISFSTINTIVPFVADEQPEFIVRPYSGDATPQDASLLGTFMNHLWRSPEMEGSAYVANAVWDWLVYGDGYAFVGWEVKEDPVYSANGEIIEGRGQERAQYFVERINPWDVWIDPYSDGIHNARWVCRRIMMPVDELQNDERYNVKEDLAGGSIGTHEGFDPEDQDRLDYFAADGGWVALYEFYDKRENWLLTFTLDGDLPVRYIEHITCPIVQIGNYRSANSPYHIGELEMISSLQDELNKTRSQMITHRRRNIAKWMYRRDRLDEDAVAAMRSSIINDAIPVDGNEPFAELAQQITATPLTADSYQIEAAIRNDINEITGVNEYLRGVPQDISRTATEASIIEGATNVRTRHKLIQVETFNKRIGQLMLDIIGDTLPLTDVEEMRMYVTGREAQALNREMGAEDVDTDLIISPQAETFRGKYVVDVERGSTELRNPQRQAQKFKEMAQILLNASPSLMQLGIQVNVRRALELWFEAEGIQDIDAMFEGEEQQQMMQQLALQQQINAANPQQPGQEGGIGQQGPVRGAPTSPGDPRAATTQAPQDEVSPDNSGMLGARQY